MASVAPHAIVSVAPDESPASLNVHTRFCPFSEAEVALLMKWALPAEAAGAIAKIRPAKASHVMTILLMRILLRLRRGATPGTRRQLRAGPRSRRSRWLTGGEPNGRARPAVRGGPAGPGPCGRGRN